MITSFTIQHQPLVGRGAKDFDFGITGGSGRPLALDVAWGPSAVPGGAPHPAHHPTSQDDHEAWGMITNNNNLRLNQNVVFLYVSC